MPLLERRSIAGKSQPALCPPPAAWLGLLIKPSTPPLHQPLLPSQGRGWTRVTKRALSPSGRAVQLGPGALWPGSPLHTHPWPGAGISTQMDRQAKCSPADEIEADRKEQPSSPNPRHCPQSPMVGWGPPLPREPTKCQLLLALCSPPLGASGDEVGPGRDQGSPSKSNPYLWL